MSACCDVTSSGQTHTTLQIFLNLIKHEVEELIIALEYAGH